MPHHTHLTGKQNTILFYANCRYLMRYTLAMFSMHPNNAHCTSGKDIAIYAYEHS